MREMKCSINPPLALAIILVLSLHVHAQRDRIPDAVAKGAVGSVASAPSGQMPAVADLLRSALKPRKKRVTTKTTRAAKEKRLESKKRRGEVKRMRGLRHE